MHEVGHFKEHLFNLGVQIRVRRKEGRSTTGILNNYVFKGAPGTGKTTVAKKFAAVLHAFGVLATPRVLVTSARDLEASYVGQTKDRVHEKVNAARGGVLFIDEAYELGKGKFGEDAIAKLTSMLTEEPYTTSVIVIIAGYTRDMDEMLARNDGLKSRFKGELEFPDWSNSNCSTLIFKLASASVPEPYTWNAPREQVQQLLHDFFEKLRALPGWGNARDAQTLFDRIVRERDLRIGLSNDADAADDGIVIQDVSKALDSFLRARRVNQRLKAATSHADVDSSAQAADIEHKVQHGVALSAHAAAKHSHSAATCAHTDEMAAL
jgi:SpoVK/Ycf46/Vps4 family AAA+-type ATPase